jgi:hypothetical protein
MSQTKTNEIPSPVVTPRLHQAFEAGSVVGLFGVLCDWPVDELKALEQDLDLFHAAQIAAIETAYGRFRATHKTYGTDLSLVQQKLRELDMVCSEILSVIFFYQDRNR